MIEGNVTEHLLGARHCRQPTSCGPVLPAAL